MRRQHTPQLRLLGCDHGVEIAGRPVFATCGVDRAHGLPFALQVELKSHFTGVENPVGSVVATETNIRVEKIRRQSLERVVALAVVSGNFHVERHLHEVRMHVRVQARREAIQPRQLRPEVDRDPCIEAMRGSLRTPSRLKTNTRRRLSHKGQSCRHALRTPRE